MNGGIRSADSLNGNVGFACYHDVSGDMLKEAAQVHGHSFAVVPFLRKQNSLRTFKYSLENPLYIPASDLQIDGTGEI